MIDYYKIYDLKKAEFLLEKYNLKHNSQKKLIDEEINKEKSKKNKKEK